MTARRAVRIWLPDGEACRVEWYLSDRKALGVNNISDDWIPHDIKRDQRKVGFVEPDIPRDDLIAPEAKKAP